MEDSKKIQNFIELDDLKGLETFLGFDILNRSNLKYSVEEVVLKKGCLELFLFLKDKDYDFSYCWCLHDAIEGGNVEIVKLVFDGYDNINEQDDADRTPLNVACEVKNPEIVAFLLEKKPALDLADFDGKRPLYIACENGSFEIVKQLIKAGDDPYKYQGKTYSPDLKWKESPFNVAVKKGHLEIVKYIGIDFREDNSRESPLHYACLNRKGQDVLRFLIESGHKPNHVLQNEQLLRQACAFRNIEMMRLLLENGVSPNVNVPSYGWTADVLEVLLEFGFSKPHFWNSEMLSKFFKKKRDTNCFLKEKDFYSVVKLPELKLLFLAREKNPESPLYKENFPLDLFKEIYSETEQILKKRKWEEWNPYDK